MTSGRRLDDGPLAVGSRVRVAQPRIPSDGVCGDRARAEPVVHLGGHRPRVRTTARQLLEELGTGGTRVTPPVGQALLVGAVTARFYRQLTVREPRSANRLARPAGPPRRPRVYVDGRR